MSTEANNTLTLHGVFVQMYGEGILITGHSGIGKSELALNLISRGHYFIADDAVEFIKSDANTLMGQAPALLKDFLEIRGLGLLEIPALFSQQVMLPTAKLSLVLELIAMDNLHLSAEDRLTGIRKTRKILGVDFPELVVPISAGRSSAILTECAVKNFQLSQQGSAPYKKLIARQQAAINSEK